MGHSSTWHEGRRLGIGGSDIGAIAGLSKYGSPMSVYLDKIGAGEETEENDAMEWGTRLEEAVARKFADEHPEFDVRKHRDETGEEVRFVSDRYPFAFAHPDRLLHARHVNEAGLVETSIAPVALWECKTAGRESRKHNWEDETGELIVPDSVMAQIQWYLGVLELPVAYLSVLFEGRTYREFVIDFDPALFEQLVEIGARFWTLVETKTPPAIDGSPATSEVLAILYRETVDDVIDAPELEELIERRIEAKEAISQMETILAGIDNQIKARLGEHVTGRAGRYTVTWKPQTRSGGIDAKKLAEEHPEIAEQYAKPSTTFRILRIVGEE